MVLAPLGLLDSVDLAMAWMRSQGVRRLVVDSRCVQAGDAFVAWPGAAHDGRRFVPMALEAGAVACLVDAAGVDSYGFDDPRVAAMPDLKSRLGELAAAFEGHPSRDVEVVAFTATNGKTSSAWWLAQASSQLHRRASIVGTLGIGEPSTGVGHADLQPTGLTTPDPVTFQRALGRMRQQGIARCALEASSIGIVEQRLRGTDIAVAVFGNFTQDHLDYHGTLEAYWAAKRSLFDWSSLRAAVVNIDDGHGQQLALDLQARGWSVQPEGGRQLWSVGTAPGARLRLVGVHPQARGMRLDIAEGEAPMRSVEVPFIGTYNALNLMGVMGALRALGHPLDDVLAVLPRLTAVPGRMEQRGGEGEPLAVIDYAHTPDALDKALAALRTVVQARGGRLWCVFGCGGDRDRSKRPLMGAVAQRLADAVVLTSDNPRSETPAAIIADVSAGMVAPGPVHIETDRAAAVQWALTHAATADVVLVAGKGHEDYQEIAGVRHPCRDQDLVDAGLAARVARTEPSTQGLMTLGEVARLLPQAHLIGDPHLPVLRVHTDTRTVRQGDLFVALRGERFDGHHFLAQAVAAGASAVLAEEGLDKTALPGVQVQNSLTGLQQLAAAWRSGLSLPLIGVTGSNGKTTVTQMTASILRAWHGPCAGATRGNLNNHIGVPLTLLSLRRVGPQPHLSAVVELGMNHPGEIAQLAAMAQPTVAVVNNAQREHQEFMHTVEAVARENGAVLQALPSHGVAVFPADDAYADLWRSMAAPRRVLTFAIDVVDEASAPAEVLPAQRADVQAQAHWTGRAWALRMHTPLGNADATVSSPGVHNVHNALAAATAALAAGAPLAAIVQGLDAFSAVQGRSMRLDAQRLGMPIQLVDDSYNANPDSVRAAIDLLSGLPGPQALILGDMGEVGDQGPAFHAEIGAYAASRGLAHLWCTGDLCVHAADAAGSIARHFESVEGLVRLLPELPQVASVLVKGSRFMRMERVVQALHPTVEAH